MRNCVNRDTPSRLGQPYRDSLQLLRVLFASATALLLLFSPIEDPWVALTVRALAVACVLSIALTPSPRLLVSCFLAGSILLSTPSMLGEHNGIPGVVLALAACVLSIFGRPHEQRSSSVADMRITVLFPMLLLCVYWAFETLTAESGSARFVLGYCSALLLVLAVFLWDVDAVQKTLTVLAFFVAVLGYVWILTNIVNFLGSITPVTVSSAEYILREKFVYQIWGPGLITNSRGFFDIMRASQLSGEPGAWALFAAIGTAAAGIVLPQGTRRRRIVLAGGVLSIVSSQSSGAMVSLLAAVVAALALTAARGNTELGVRSRFPLAVLAGLSAVIIPFAIRFFIDAKASVDLDSVVARGLGFLSGTRAASDGSRISLIAALGVDGVVASLPILGLVILVVILRSNPYAFGLAVFFLMMGLFIQPVLWHLAVWFACSLFAIVVVNRPDPSTANIRRPVGATKNS